MVRQLYPEHGSLSTRKVTKSVCFFVLYTSLLGTQLDFCCNQYGKCLLVTQTVLESQVRLTFAPGHVVSEGSWVPQPEKWTMKPKPNKFGMRKEDRRPLKCLESEVSVILNTEWRGEGDVSRLWCALWKDALSLKFRPDFLMAHYFLLKDLDQDVMYVWCIM